MAMFRVAGGDLLTETEFQRSEPGITAFMLGEDAALGDAALRIDSGLAKDFRAALDADPEWKPTPIVEGGPLSIQIRHVYTGRYPKDGWLTSKRADMLLTSALKDYSVAAPASRAINFLSPKVGAMTHLERPAATEQGTPIIAYYPAVLADSLTLTVDIGFDSFPDGLFGSIGSAFKSLAELPIFMPYAGYLMVAGSLVKLTGDIADKLIDHRPKFTQTATLNFNYANGPVSTADLRILCNPTFDRSKYRYEWERGLVAKDTGNLYEGEEPYMVLLVDGAARPNLKDFAPTVASAAMIERFLSGKEGSEVAIEGLVGAMRLWNDYQYRMDAEKIAKQLDEAGIGAEDKAALTKKYNAMVANIQSDELKLPKKT